MVLARTAGYTLAEIDDMDIAYLLDLLTTQVNHTVRKRANKKPGTRKATQADYDRL